MFRSVGGMIETCTNMADTASPRDSIRWGVRLDAPPMGSGIHSALDVQQASAIVHSQA